MSCGRVIPSVRANARCGARGESSSRTASSQVSHASLNLIPAAISSVVSKAGGSPASSGRSWRSEAAKAWSVRMAAWSRSVMPWRQRARSSSLRDSSADASSNPWRMRSRSSAAAASVNVMAAIRSRVVLPVVTRFTTPPHQACRLAGARAGLDKQRFIQLLADDAAGLGVDGTQFCRTGAGGRWSGGHRYFSFPSPDRAR